MAERLFQNQLRPQAQPINTFIQPQQFRRAGAAQQPLLGRVSQIATLQQAGTSGVKGYNQFEQMANALAPLNKNLTSALDKGFKQYAKGNIEAGYYDELRNQQAQGVMNLQQSQESGAAEAASMITALEKVDPVASSLLREANPWKAIGRRRAMAQLAAGQVSSVLNAELINNSGQLAGIKPGSPELMRVKQGLTSKVLSTFQLTGNEPEAAYYVTPVINKSWDIFTQAQSKLYGEELEVSTIQSTNATVFSAFELMVKNGIDVGGVKFMPGSPEWANAAGLKMTDLIDNGLALLGGKSRVEAMKEINKTLGGLANIPGAFSAIGSIRVGDRRTPMKLRPLWRNANPAELTDYTTSGLKGQRLLNEERQSAGKIKIEENLVNTVAGLMPGSPEYKDALAKVASEGYAVSRDSAKIVQDWSDEQEALFSTINAPSFEQLQQITDGLMNLRPSDLDTNEKVNAAYKAAAALAKQSAADPATQAENYQKYVKVIRDKQSLFAKMPTGAALEATLGRLVKEDLQGPDLASLQPKASTGNWFNRAPAQNPNGQKLKALDNTLRGLYATEISKGYADYFEKNPTATEVPMGKQVAIRENAASAVREGQAYKDAKKLALTKKPPAPMSDGTPQRQPGVTPQPGKPRDAFNTITPEEAKQFKEKKLINNYSMWSEMQKLVQNKPVSKAFYDLAKKAGTSTDRFLLEQMTFSPGLDPTGSFKKVLQERIERARQTNTPAAANEQAATDPMGNQSYRARDPGSWFFSLFERPAAAGTLPPSIRSIPSIQPSGSSNRVVNGNWITPSGYEIVQYVTGDVTAPHDGDAVIVDPAGHGGAAYHNHYEFATVAGRKRAAAAFRAAGFRVTSEYRPGDPGSHGVGRGLDVAPPLDLPYTAEAEARWSRAANAILGFVP